MKLWYQSMARHDALSSYASVLREIIDKVIDLGTEVQIAPIEKSGGIGDQYRFFEFIDMRDVISNFIRAENEGYDAFLIGNIGDPCLYEGREITNMPVLGLCETCLHIACMMGRSFGLVTLSKKFTPRILDNVIRYRLNDRLSSVCCMNVESLPTLDKAYNQKEIRDKLFKEFFDAGRRVAEEGAEVIIPAGGVVMALLAREGIYNVEGVPILNGIITLIKTGEMVVKLSKIMDGFTSKIASFKAPSGRVMEEIKSAYGDDFEELPFIRLDRE
jgi:allantoin racemase